MIFDTHISDDTDALRDSVKRMCDDELAPRAAAIDQQNEFPMDMWKKASALEKHRLYFFLFETRLPYTKNEGFRTADLASSTRIFEEFVDANSDAVDPCGFEPHTPSLQMRCSTK